MEFNHLSDEAISQVPLVLRSLREARKWSRAEIARRLKVTGPVIYNIESGRTRMTLSVFFRFVSFLGFDSAQILHSNMFSIHAIDELQDAISPSGVASTMKIVAFFRARLKLTQKQMAQAMGYSSSMCHHFEKGIREATVVDLLKMMALTEDNVRGFIRGLGVEESLAEVFPEGMAAQVQSWEEYWSSYYVSAVRQIMRTDLYRGLTQYRLGFFARVLGISVQEEEHALRVLGKLGIAKFVKGKPTVDANVRILIPKNISTDVLTRFKMSWVDYMTKRFKAGVNPDDILSVDLIHANPTIFKQVVQTIRMAQNQVHNVSLDDTSGFMCLGWMGSFTSAH